MGLVWCGRAGVGLNLETDLFCVCLGRFGIFERGVAFFSLTDLSAAFSFAEKKSLLIVVVGLSREMISCFTYSYTIFIQQWGSFCIGIDIACFGR